MSRTVLPGAWAIAAMVAMAGGPAASETSAPATLTQTDKDFTFKRVKVGQGSFGARRILVQIDPVEQAKVLETNPAVPALPTQEIKERIAAMEGGAAKAARAVARDGPGPGPAPGASYEWFWKQISPDLADSGFGRMDKAILALGKGPGGSRVGTPRLSTMQAIADAYGAEILQATIGTKVSPALALAVISIESAGRPAAVSSAGASGLMQLMPATARRFGVTDRNDPAQNISGGVAYLDWLLDRFGRDPLMALAGYNAGENAVTKHNGIPPYRETRDYVPKVIAAWTVARGLCLTPPQLVSDGCVFRRGVQTAARITD